mgnify:CR=1 FL=1|jgi:DNA-binding transcriptional MerR regulator
MKHKIGDIAKLMGLTPEAIRYYEKMGIICPIKAHDSGYRYYDVWDIHVLVRARVYRQYGFSMSETVDLISKYEPADIVSSLSAEEEDLQETIIWNLNLLQQLREMQQIINDAVSSIGKYYIQLRPAMYFLKTQDGYELIDSRLELYRDWIEKVPFVFPGGIYGKDVCENRGNEFAFGLIVERRYAPLLNIDKTDDIVYLPSCPSIYISFQSGSQKILSPQTFAPAIEFMNSRNLELNGDVVSRVALMKRTGNEYLSWHQAWLPFEYETTRISDKDKVLLNNK